MNQLQYIVTASGENREVFPSGVRSLEETYTLSEEDRRFAFVPELNASLTFGGADFLYFKTLEANKCRIVPLTINTYCGTGYVLWRNCTLRMLDGEWNLDDCTVTIKPRLINEYTCFEDNAEEEVNLLELPLQPITVNYLIGTIEKFFYSSPTPDADDPAHFGGVAPASLKWKLYASVQEVKTPQQEAKDLILGPSTIQPQYWYYYAREIYFNATSPGPDWVNVGGTKWARFPLLIKDYNEYTSATNENGFQEKYLSRFLIFGSSGTGIFDNGRKLNDALSYFVSNTCNISIKSIFLGINGDADFDTTYPDFDIEVSTQNIFYQKSDVKRPDDLNNATKLPYTFKKLLVNVCNLYNLWWRIEEGVFRIEHVSWYERAQTLDLSVNPRLKEVVRTRTYTYTTEKLPKYEIFKFMEAGSPDFLGVPIEYTGACVSIKKNEREKTVALDQLTTDLLYCIENAEGDSEKVSDEGLFLMATRYVSDNRWEILTTDPIFEANRTPNNVLGWSYLHKMYFPYERPQIAGYLNKVYTTFHSAKPIKKRDKLWIKFCCDDTINLTGTVNTEMGLAVIGSGTYSPYNSTLELQLLYADLTPPPACLKPAVFRVVSLANNQWTLETQFNPPGTYTTITEVTYPDGHVESFTKENDTDGTFSFDYGNISNGTIKLRKRISGEDCEWTDWVSADAIVPPTCETTPLPTPELFQRVRFTFTFRFMAVISEDMQVRVTLPGGSPKDATPDISLSSVTIATFNILDAMSDLEKQNAQIYGLPRGNYVFSFRKVCSDTTFSPWVDKTEFISS